MSLYRMNHAKAVRVSSIGFLVLGVLLVIGGIWGAVFTYQSVAREQIVTPADAAIPEAPVRGPFTLKAQADEIRGHVLRMTEGKTYAEMPRQIQKLNADGQPMLDAEGKPVMTANTARDTWVTATTLMTALNLALLAYGVCALAIVFGIVTFWFGWLLRELHPRS